MKATTSNRRAVSQGRETHPTNPQQQASKLPPQQVLDDYAMDRIDYRVKVLADAFELSGHEQEDLRQDMMVEVLSAFEKRFDPAKASRKTFLCRVLAKFVKHWQRTRCTHQRRPCDSPVVLTDMGPGYEPVTNEARQGEFDDQAKTELRLDMETVAERMPERLREVYRLLLAGHTAHEVAEKLTVCPGTVYRYIGQIRDRLAAADLDPRGNQRDKFASAADVEGEGKQS